MRTILCFVLLCSLATSVHGQVYDFDAIDPYDGRSITATIDLGIGSINVNVLGGASPGDFVFVPTGEQFIAPGLRSVQTEWLDEASTMLYGGSANGFLYAFVNEAASVAWISFGQHNPWRFISAVDRSITLRPTPAAAAVPEPTSWWLVSLIGLPWMRRLWM